MLLRLKQKKLTRLSLNHYWRIIAAGLSYTAFGLGAFVPGIYAIILFFAPINELEKQRRIRNSIKGLCRFFVDMMQFYGLMNYRLETHQNATVKGHLVIANHPTLIDAAFAIAYVDDLCCVVKKSLTRNPFTAIPVKLAKYIPNDSENLVELATEKLNSGQNLLIFPEGTRNQYDTQLDFKRGAANIAVQAQSPVLPIVISCLPRALGKHEPWYQLPSIKSRFLIRFLPSQTLEECIDISKPRTMQYRELTRYWKSLYLKNIQSIK